jgi:hypothetical protein
MSVHDPDKNYDVILIDTSIFDGNGLRLEAGLLGKLRQFKKTNIDILLPDVIKNEIQSHLEKKIKVSRSSLEKSINDAGDHLFFDGSALNEAKKLLIDSNEIEQLAHSRLESFVNDTGALEIECNDYVSVGEILGQYFSNKPPFSETGKKKNEFPDAIILLAAEEWAKREEKSILAIAKDKDWKSYCENSLNIDYEEDFTAGLASFNAETAPFAFVENLTKQLEDDLAQSFITQVENGLESALDGFTPDQDAESQFYWEPNGSHGWFESFSFIDDTFRIIESDQEYLVLEAKTEITVGAEGEFSLSVHDSIDKDYVGLGSTSASTEATFESAILITICGDLTEGIDAIEIEQVEVVTPIRTIHFGTLELDYGEYD